MSYIEQSRKLVEEFEAILKSNNDIEVVSVGAVTPLASETASSAVYIGIESVAMEMARLSKDKTGYDRHMLINLYCNYDGTDDALGVYDFADSIEKSIIQDSTIWSFVVDRDLVAINFDSQEHAPKRAFTMLFDIYFRVACT